MIVIWTQAAPRRGAAISSSSITACALNAAKLSTRHFISRSTRRRRMRIRGSRRPGSWQTLRWAIFVRSRTSSVWLCRRSACRRAEESFRNLIFNQRSTPPRNSSMATWKACGDQPCNPRTWKGALFCRPRPRRDQGHDGAGAGVRRDDGDFDVVPFCWLPGETLREREDEDRMPYRVWAQRGAPLTFPGRTTDPKAVALKIAELHGLYNIQAWLSIVGGSRTSGASSAIGCDVELMPFGQGFRDMAPAVDLLERLVEEASCGTAIIRF